MNSSFDHSDKLWSFEHPEVLWLLLLVVPALSAFFWWSWRQRRQLIAQFVQSRLLAALTVGVSVRRQKIRLALIVASVALIGFVLARPQWGYDWEEARQRGLDIVVAVDTSRSMLADDIKPNRLARAKLAAMDLRRLARNDRLGLVAFAGNAFLQCPLTMDDEPFRLSVEALNVEVIPQGGTALAEAIQCALGAFKEKSDNYKVLVLFSDGEDHDGHALDGARAAAKEGLRIFTIGIGTANGELLPTSDAKGRTEFVKDEKGDVVKSRLNESLLEQIASAGQGFYRRLAGADTIELLYERGLEPLPKAEFSARRVQRWHERYQWFLGLTLVLLLIEVFLPERRLARRPDDVLSGGANEELRRAVALLLAVALPCLAIASPRVARKEFEARNYTSALLEYEDLLKDRPNDPRLNYNAGAAAYRARNYEKALHYYRSALASPEAEFQQQSYYNIGNAQYRLGEDESDPTKKQTAWQDAALNYENATQLNPDDKDAKFNLDYVKKKLEELKQQQQQQSQDDKDKKDDQQKQDQQKQDQQKQDQQKSDQNQTQQEKKPEDSKDQKPPEQQPQDQQPQPAQDAQPKDTEEQQGAEAKRGGIARMTLQDALKLLDTTKDEENLLPFHLQLRTNRADRIFKNW